MTRNIKPNQTTNSIRPVRRNAFTLMELLVVIGIIVLLVGMLLHAMSAIRTQSRQVATQTLMKSFASAADAFFLDTGRYPGALSERQLSNADNEHYLELSGTENAMIELLGGLFERGEDDFQLGDLQLYRDDIGRGPMINGTHHEAYFVPKPADLYYVKGQDGQTNVDNNLPDEDDPAFPDLVDSWGTPIIFWRSTGQKSTINNGNQLTAGSPTPDESANYYWYSFQSYTASEALMVGKGHNAGINEAELSLLSMLNDDEIDELTQLLVEHPSIPRTQRGGYILMSAGKDMVYFSEDEFDEWSDPEPHINDLDMFDDVLMWGGS